MFYTNSNGKGLWENIWRYGVLVFLWVVTINIAEHTTVLASYAYYIGIAALVIMLLITIRIVQLHTRKIINFEETQKPKEKKQNENE